MQEFIHQAGFRVKASKQVFFTPEDKEEHTITGVRIRRDKKLSAPLNFIETLREDLRQAKEQAACGRVDRNFKRADQYFGQIHFVRWLDKNTGNQLLAMYRKVNWNRLEKTMEHHSL